MSVRSLVSRFRGHEEFHVDFMGRRRLWLAISGGAILVSLLAILVLKLNFGIDFRGGAQLTYPNPTGVTAQEVREELADLGRSDAVVQLVNDDTEITVRTDALGADRDEVVEALAEQAGVEPAQINVDEVGPKWGQQISGKALQGLLIFLVLVSLYISMRFEWKMAVSAIVALVHDLAITAGVYALIGREVTPETVIALLTILGYSLYDTVVIFDKIQENAEAPGLVQRETFSGAVNISLNQVLMRSVNTSLTSLLPVGALLLLGGETLKNFAFALFVGMAVGTYSSIFVAAPVFTWLKEREPKMA
ncbi:MAG TPA: protein translocase subunit SecF, partial [Actinomycetota bacterium]|nr:protein translocase subunit SecF [Actinomycetota bacterium]